MSAATRVEVGFEEILAWCPEAKLEKTRDEWIFTVNDKQVRIPTRAKDWNPVTEILMVVLNYYGRK